MAKSIKSDPISKMAIELASTIASFSNPSVLKGYYQAAITINLFKNEKEYNDFFDLLIQYMEQIAKSAIFDDENTSLSEAVITPTANIFKTMMTRYPKATDAFILEAIYDLKQPKYIKESLAYISKKDVVSKRLVERTSKSGSTYVSMGMITSKTIESYFKENNLTRAEQKFIDVFLGGEFARGIFEEFHFNELALCSKDPRFIDVATFSCYSLFQNKELSSSEKYDEFVDFIKGEIKNIDIDKLQFMFLIKYLDILKSSQTHITCEGLMSLEKRVDMYEQFIPNSARIDAKPNKFVIPDPNSIKFELVSSITGKPINPDRKLPTNMKVSEFPVFVITEQDLHNTLGMVFHGMSITKREWFKQFNDLLISRKLELLIDSCDDLEPISEYLRKIRFTEDTIRLLYDKLHDNEEKNEKSSRVLARLTNDKIFSLNAASIYDCDEICNLIESGQIAIDMIRIDRIKNNTNRTKLIELSLKMPELYNKLLAAGIISKRDISDLELSSYTKLIETFFNTQELTIEEFAKFVRTKKLLISDIDTMNLENVNISDEDIVSIYLRILEKRNEYREYVNDIYIERGIDEEIPETEEEKQLQEELQKLIDLKNIYIALFKKQKLSPLVNYHKTKDIYNQLIDILLNGDNFDIAFPEITTMLYEDNMISMAQVNEMDKEMFIEILKSGHARKEDIDKFKEEIVSLDDIEKIKAKLPENLNENELAEALRVEIYKLRYNRLFDLMDKIAQDSNISKEEKISMLYSIFSKSTKTEKTHRDFFESTILVKVYSKLKVKRNKPIIDPDDEIDFDDDIDNDLDDDIKSDVHKNPSREFVYPTNIIWNFIELLDPEYSFKVLSDGYVVFESKKLNKVFIENVWQTGENGDFVRRGYGTTTLIMDLDVYKSHQAEIIRLGRHGYKVNVLKAKSYLPKIQTSKGEKTTGMIRHEKDLKNTGKKIWFELILEHLGINQEQIDAHTSQYTREDLERLESFINDSRNKREEITK